MAQYSKPKSFLAISQSGEKLLVASSSIFKGNFSLTIISTPWNLVVRNVCLGLLDLFVSDMAAKNNDKMEFFLE